MPTPFQHGYLVQPTKYNRTRIRAQQLLKKLEDQTSPARRFKSRERGMLEYFLCHPGYELLFHLMCERFYEDTDLSNPDFSEAYRTEMNRSIFLIRQFLEGTPYTIETILDEQGKTKAYILT